MPGEEHFRKLEHLYLGAPINQFYRPGIHIGAGTAEVTLTVRPDLFHPAHSLHGSVYFKVLDDAAFFAVNSLVDDVFMLTVSFTVYLLRPVTEGVITSQGRIVHSSSRLFVAESRLVDGAGRQVATGSGTFMRSQTPLTPEVGYA